MLNPTLRIPDWSFEHAPKFSVTRLVGTWSRLFKPRRFWERFPIEAPVRRGRLIGYGALCLGATVGPLTARLAGWAAFEYSTDPMAIPRTASGLAHYVLAQLRENLVQLLLAPTLCLVWIMALVFPIMVALLLPMTFAMARVRRSQILRCGVYSLTIPAAGVFSLLTLELLDVGAGLPMDAYWENHALLFPLAHIVWLGWWWHAALARYLKLPGAGKVLFWHGTAAILAGLAFATRVLGMSL